MNDEKLVALIDVLIDERISELPTIQGKRGYKGAKGLPGKPGVDGKDGKDGKSFTWEEFKDQILEEIKANAISGPKGERGLRGLKGKDGLDGKNGKDFSWEDHAESIEALVEKYRLKFEHLSEDQKLELRGLRGPRGQRGKDGKQGEQGIPGQDGKDGKDFSWEEHKEVITEIIQSNKLKFEDFTEKELYELRGQRGARGQRGKPGQNGLSAYEIWSEKNKGSMEDFLFSLRGKDGVPGVSGLNGKDGKDGQDGADGEDAPRIIDVRIFTTKDKFYFKFYFEDGTLIETNKVDFPVIKKLLKVSETVFQKMLVNYQATTLSYDTNKRVDVVKNYLDNEKTYLGSIEEITYSNNLVDYIIEKIYSGESNDENPPNRLLTNKKIDLIYLDNFLTEIKVINNE